MVSHRFSIAHLLAGLAVLGLFGCGRSAPTDAVAASHRQRLLLADEPSNAVTVLDLKEAFAGPGEVTLVGRIGGVPDPWTKGRAEFVLADPSVLVAVEGHEHDCGDNCPYCKKKQDEKLEGLALVSFADEQGKTLPIDARKLFNLSSDQTVVVRGLAQLDPTGNLVINANGLYIRR